jgi:hypothetical protein
MIGATYTRRADAPRTYPPSVRIVGQFNGEWTVTNAETFGPTFAVAPSELSRLYDAPLDAPTLVDEDALRRPSRDALRAALTGYRAENGPSNTPDPDGPESPEQVFQRVAAERDAALR